MAEKMGVGQAIVTLAIVAGGYWYFFGSDSAKQSSADAQKKAISTVQKKMVEEYVQQYEIIKRQGSATDRCMHANLVKGGFLGAKDEANYAKWRVIAESECKAAGAPSL